MDPGPATKREQTKWAATFLVAGELARRGWKAGLTHGNTSTADILANHPGTGATITIDVKGIRIKGTKSKGTQAGASDHWFGDGLVGEARTKDRHFMVFVALPMSKDPVRFYIVPGKRAVAMAEYNRDLPGANPEKSVPNLWERPRPSYRSGKSLENYQDRWGDLGGPSDPK